jgi:hypothetical protein
MVTNARAFIKNVMTTFFSSATQGSKGGSSLMIILANSARPQSQVSNQEKCSDSQHFSKSRVCKITYKHGVSFLIVTNAFIIFKLPPFHHLTHISLTAENQTHIDTAFFTWNDLRNNPLKLWQNREMPRRLFFVQWHYIFHYPPLFTSKFLFFEHCFRFKLTCI